MELRNFQQFDSVAICLGGNKQITSIWELITTNQLVKSLIGLY
jgi:hypothetical protein